jgi:hypothetical protein
LLITTTSSLGESRLSIPAGAVKSAARSAPARRPRSRPLRLAPQAPATLIEAWGLRAGHDRSRLLAREEIAEASYQEEYEPVVQVLRDTGIGGAGTETERYLRIATLR